MAGLPPFVFSLLLFLCLTAPGKTLYGQATGAEKTLYGALYGQATAPDRSPDRPPNIVLVIGDDHGFPYFGFTGSEHVRTPNLDLLAHEGTTFSFAHVTANHCRPSLQTLVTGLYPAQYQRLADRYHAEAIRGDPAWEAASGEARRRRDVVFLAQDHAPVRHAARTARHKRVRKLSGRKVVGSIV